MTDPDDLPITTQSIYGMLKAQSVAAPTRTATWFDATVLKPTAGPLRRRRGPEPYDLCRTCSEALAAFLSPPRLPTLEPVEDAEPITVPV